MLIEVKVSMIFKTQQNYKEENARIGLSEYLIAIKNK